MKAIRHVETGVLWENPKPHVRSRHAYFPGAVRLPSGQLLALFVISEAFESADATTWIARSSDSGRTWSPEGPLCPNPDHGLRASDYLKPTVLRDGKLIAIGYRFYRDDPEQGIGIPETGGILPGDDLVSFSLDEGRSWTPPAVIPRSWPELLELSGPCVETTSGELLALGSPMKLPDGSNPSGQRGLLLRSLDGGQSWNDCQTYFRAPGGNMTPLEARLCEMQDGRLVAICWAYDYQTERHLPNHAVVSHDGGTSWSVPINTGHMGQAANLMPWEGDLLLSIHAHRSHDRPGIYVRVIDFADNCWKPVHETQIYGHGMSQTLQQQDLVRLSATLRFGQPSLLRLDDREILAFHWCIEDGQGKIRQHRLVVEG